MRRMRASGPLKSWLTEKVLGGMLWPTLRKLLHNSDLNQVSKQILSDLHVADTYKQDLNTSLEQVPEALKADYQLVKNIARTACQKHQRLDADVIQSLKQWAEKLRAMGWHVLSHVSDKPTPKVLLAFFSPWQK